MIRISKLPLQEIHANSLNANPSVPKRRLAVMIPAHAEVARNTRTVTEEISESN